MYLFGFQGTSVTSLASSGHSNADLSRVTENHQKNPDVDDDREDKSPRHLSSKQENVTNLGGSPHDQDSDKKRYGDGNGFYHEDQEDGEGRSARDSADSHSISTHSGQLGRSNAGEHRQKVSKSISRSTTATTRVATKMATTATATPTSLNSRQPSKSSIPEAVTEALVTFK